MLRYSSLHSTRLCGILHPNCRDSSPHFASLYCLESSSVWLQAAALSRQWPEVMAMRRHSWFGLWSQS
jgi:hypothetical protein